MLRPLKIAGRAIQPVCAMLALAASLISCGSPRVDLIILAAGGAKPALDDICAECNLMGKYQVTVSYAGGGELLQQMRWGNLGDIYIAPEQSYMEQAIEFGVVDAGTLTTIAFMIPVIAVQKGNPKNIRSIQDLACKGTRVALTSPETTLLGRLAPEIIEKAGLTDAISENIVAYASDPNNLMHFITTGNVDAGITWHFYATFTDKLEIVPFSPHELTGIGEMQAAVTTYSKNPNASSEFLTYLISKSGCLTFERHGYIVHSQEVSKYWNQY